MGVKLTHIQIFKRRPREGAKRRKHAKLGCFMEERLQFNYQKVQHPERKPQFQMNIKKIPRKKLKTTEKELPWLVNKNLLYCLTYNRER